MVKIIILEDERTMKERCRSLWEQTKNLYLDFINSETGIRFKKGLRTVFIGTLFLITFLIALN